MRLEVTPRRTDWTSTVIAAGRATLHAAFADARAIAAWLPPGDMTCRVQEYDFREDGRYRIELTYGDDAPDGVGKTTARSDISTGRFLTIRPGERIMYSVEFESADATPAGEMIMTWTFEPAGEGARVTVIAENVPAVIAKADHDAGMRSSLENLARHVG